MLNLTQCAFSPHREKAYEQGYKDASRTVVRKNLEPYFGNDFPYFYWHQPLVQYVTVPAHVSGGVFIPEHEEIVMIKPGEWKMNEAFPISTQEKNNEHAKEENHALPAYDITSN